MSEVENEQPAASATAATGAGASGRAVIGNVISARMDKTATVRIDRQILHPLYKKFIRRSTKLHVHDAGNECREGDKVLIEECRPISRTKSWRLVRILERPE
jgi:small subunit ribosomal protein S17